MAHMMNVNVGVHKDIWTFRSIFEISDFKISAKILGFYGRFLKCCMRFLGSFEPLEKVA